MKTNVLSFKVGLNSTHLVTQCLCKHLSFFGSSFFVTPNLVDPSRTAELFATFAENPVVVCFVGALFVTYLLVVVWARRKDIQDTAKVQYLYTKKVKNRRTLAKGLPVSYWWSDF